LVVLVGHYVDGLFDIFWIGGPTVAPYIICGVSLGMADLDKVKRAEAALDTRLPAPAATTGGVTASSGRGALRTVGRSMRAVGRGFGVPARTLPAH
jgi:hypothetical protein